MPIPSRTAALVGLLIILLIAFLCGRASAQAAPYQIQHNGTPQFSANCLVHEATSPVWDFRDSCGQPPPPAGRITTSNIAYVPATGSLRFTGLTDWSDIWGHATPFDATSPFPGRGNSQPTILNFNRNGYVCVRIHPVAVSPSFGFITHTEYNYGADLTAAISNACGNFAPPDPLCKVDSRSGQPIIRWTTKPTVYRTFCGVTVGADQYLNIKFTNPAQNDFCSANAVQCPVGTANSFGG